VPRDIIAVGASAGGVQPLVSLVAGLPADLAAAVFVVLHIPPDMPSTLADILDRAGPLPAAVPRDGEPIRHGRIYVAAPNHHLVLRDGSAHLVVGPRENGARPAVDVLFRSAARAYGSRVVGVVLSGVLRDGTLGLNAIKLRGGVTVVQDPDEAPFPGMPSSALGAAPVDYCLRVGDMPTLLTRLATASAVEPEPPLARSMTAEGHDHDHDHIDNDKPVNGASGLTCPECHGSLWEIQAAEGIRFECRVGHAYSSDGLDTAQGDAVEAALWAAINALQERAQTFRRLTDLGVSTTRSGRFVERAAQTEQQAAVLLDLLQRLVEGDDVG
jgi:two-component system chemotaxis response regulator CheB